MREIILIVIFYFCSLGRCVEQQERLTDEEAFEIFGPKNDSAPVYGIVDIPFSDRKKRDAGDLWRLCIPFSDGKTKCLNLKRTEGILANADTPVWHARGAGKWKVSYTQIQDLRMLGKLTLYQDFEAKAAVIHFHEQNIIEGFVGYYRFKRDNRQADAERRVTRYKLLQMPSKRPLTKAMPWRSRGKRDTSGKGVRRDPLPESVYPQILIQLERSDVQKNTLKTLRHALTYWNAVDMLYSDLRQPRVKPNIAGFILPQDDLSTPWVTKGLLKDWPDFIDGGNALRALGAHFKDNSHIFPKDSYDFMFSFTGLALDAAHKILGLANYNVPCAVRHAQVALIHNDLENYAVGAHELGHLLSGDHDENAGCASKLGIMGAYATGSPDNLVWSSCTRSSIQKYFTRRESRCLDSCPKTKPNCGNRPASFLDDMPECLTPPSEICAKGAGKMFSGYMTCSHGAVCTDTNKPITNYCEMQPLPPELKDSCKLFGGFLADSSHLIPVKDGTICKSSNSNIVSACYRHKCVPVGPSIPQCKS